MLEDRRNILPRSRKSTVFAPQGLDVRGDTEVSNQDVLDDPVDPSIERHGPEEAEDLDDDIDEEPDEKVEETARSRDQPRTRPPSDFELRGYFFPRSHDGGNAKFFGHHRSSTELKKSVMCCYICATVWDSHGPDMTQQQKLDGTVPSSAQVPLP
jgi:hypothetical protein